MAVERDDKDHQSDSDSDSERDELQMERGSTEKPSIEQIMESKEVPPWTRQITFRAMAVSVLLSIVLSFIVMKLNVTTGVIPSLNIAAALLGFLFIKIWIKLTGKVGLKNAPFTRQENTVIQTCVVASSGIAFSSGLASYILGMTGNIAKQADTGNTHINIKEITLPWLIGFITVVSFVGLFSIVPLRKIMILEYKLSYPSGTATAYLINSFHTPTGAKLAKKQVRSLFKWFSASFTWAFFQWFYTASDDCGFAAFPTFGLQAYKYKFFFDFSSTYVGVGMICPYLINLSMLFGSVLSWGVMWPLIEKRKGDWYPADVPGSSFKGIQGYRVFISIAMILGDGLYHFVVVLGKTFYAMYKASKDKHSKKDDTPNYDDERRTQFFLKDQIPLWFALLGYVLFAALSIGVVPTIFHQLKWYHILIIYLFAPILAFCNSYGCGLTDWSLASSYGKLAIFIFGVWIGIDHGGLVAGLAACGVMMSIVSTASDLMQDFKTGYLTLASPRSMFVSQIIGTLIGCIVSPLVFWFFFYKAYPNLGQPDSAYPAPYGLMYRGIAIIGTEGTSALPKNCLVLCIVFFLAAALLNLIRDVLNYYKFRAANYVPSAMAMAVPFYLGGYFVIDMCIGSLIKFVMEKSNKKRAEAFIPAMASGLICGDSLWGMPAALLSLANIQPPICMKFLSRSSNAKVDALLS